MLLIELKIILVEAFLIFNKKKEKIIIKLHYIYNELL